MTRYAFATLYAVLAFATSAQADDNSPSYVQCMDKAASTLAMNVCVTDETRVQDQRLNIAYKQLIRKLEIAQVKRLREVQRDWIAFRDKNCGFHAQLSGGSMASVEQGICVMDMTQERAAEMERLLKPEQ
ncbi:DUF1311 domain-containing protein [Pseudomonas parafulva]|uniref:DUF1311 domain-containing protein n=1 Tax=Pseudomonas parafulva TaxID=157782 RepID=A0AAI8PA99_9PSED|nr:lysozyme inhibitor LprI family protein [Pseudomonas parafulva]AXO87136.1 DUF1311 domain-containing protein [Pseudomonas parafulva]